MPRALTFEPLHVSVAAPARAPRGRGVVGHQLRLLDDEFSVVVATSPTTREQVPLPVLRDDRLLLSLAAQLSAPDLVAAVDHIRRDEAARGLLTRLQSRLRGAEALRRAVSFSADGVRSRPETLLRLAIRAAGLPEPVVGHVLAEPNWSATPDLAWPEWAVLVEYEGERHRTDQARFATDLRRFDRYLDVGWSPIRATSRDLFREPGELLARIEHRLRRNGWRPPRRWALRDVPPFLR